MMKKRLTAILAAVAAAFMLIACSPKTVRWVDGLEPEPVAPPTVDGTYTEYSERPAQKPTAEAGKAPSVTTWTAGQGYAVTGNQEKSIAWTDAPDYAYVYMQIKDWSAAYSNLRIELDNVGGEFVAIQAVYYEMYDGGLPAVTVLSPKFMRDGKNAVIARFGTTKTLSPSFAPRDELLKNQTVLGFMLYFDSLPSAPMFDRKGGVLIRSVAFLPDGDPLLEEQDVAPSITGWSATGMGFSSIDLKETDNESGGKDVRATYTTDGTYPFLEVKFVDFTDDWSAVSMTVQATDLKTLSIAVAHSGGYTMLDGAWGMQGEGFAEAKTLTYDFTALKADGSENNVIDLMPTAFYFYVDSDVANSGEITITDLHFIKTADSDSPMVGAGFNTAGAFTITDAKAGSATITYSKSSQWEPVKVGVIGYQAEYTILTLEVSFYGTENFGIAVNTPTQVVKTNREALSMYADPDKTQKGTDEIGAYKRYTFVIDLTENAENVHVSTLLFYIDAEVKVPEPRTVIFHSIAFSKPQ